MRKRLLVEIAILQSHYYLTQNLRDEAYGQLDSLRSQATRIPRREIPQLLQQVRQQIVTIKKETKCLLSNTQIRQIVSKMTSLGEGYVSVPKMHIDKHWFANYTRIFPRWPHVPIHALVMFDSNIENKSPYSFFVLEAMLFEDVQLLWQEIVRITSDGKDFRSRPRAAQRKLSSHLRVIVPAIYNFLEAYLNGIAYNCFQTFHSQIPIKDHDLLCEWDSQDKRIRFVAFERKVKEYPTIYATHLERHLDLGNDRNVEVILGEGKSLRDSFTHPSPYVHPKTLDIEKTRAIVGIRDDQVKRLLKAVVHYVLNVEEGLGRDPRKTVPWLESNQ